MLLERYFMRPGFGNAFSLYSQKLRFARSARGGGPAGEALAAVLKGDAHSSGH